MSIDLDSVFTYRYISYTDLSGAIEADDGRGRLGFHQAAQRLQRGAVAVV